MTSRHSLLLRDHRSAPSARNGGQGRRGATSDSIRRVLDEASSLAANSPRLCSFRHSSSHCMPGRAVATDDDTPLPVRPLPATPEQRADAEFRMARAAHLALRVRLEERENHILELVRVHQEEIASLERRIQQLEDANALLRKGDQ